MYVQPRRTEYPISLDIPCTTSTPSEKLSIDDTLRGKVYTYNTYTPYDFNSASSSKNYNFGIDVPSITKDSITECETKRIERLKGLKSRIDRILVPACDVPSRSSYCQC
ncbi:hypothetical protein WN48_01604 [Eufriesea mexicana]|nr:hypothetical protein WN48_01604 [Eufriesea mexicana]